MTITVTNLIDQVLTTTPPSSSNQDVVQNQEAELAKETVETAETKSEESILFEITTTTPIDSELLEPIDSELPASDMTDKEEKKSVESSTKTETETQETDFINFQTEEASEEKISVTDPEKNETEKPTSSLEDKPPTVTAKEELITDSKSTDTEQIEETVPSEETNLKETSSKVVSEKKRPAPKAPLIEETQVTAAKQESTNNEIEKEKSPLASRNIRRIDDRRRQPKTGWL